MAVSYFSYGNDPDTGVYTSSGIEVLPVAGYEKGLTQVFVDHGMEVTIWYDFPILFEEPYQCECGKPFVGEGNFLYCKVKYLGFYRGVYYRYITNEPILVKVCEEGHDVRVFIFRRYSA